MQDKTSIFNGQWGNNFSFFKDYEYNQEHIRYFVEVNATRKKFLVNFDIFPRQQTLNREQILVRLVQVGN